MNWTKVSAYLMALAVILATVAIVLTVTTRNELDRVNNAPASCQWEHGQDINTPNHWAYICQ